MNADRTKVEPYNAGLTQTGSDLRIFARNGHICSNHSDADIRIWNIAGTEMPNFNLNNGLYIVRVTAPDGTTRTFKIAL